MCVPEYRGRGRYLRLYHTCLRPTRGCAQLCFSQSDYAHSGCARSDDIFGCPSVNTTAPQFHRGLQGYRIPGSAEEGFVGDAYVRCVFRLEALETSFHNVVVSLWFHRSLQYRTRPQVRTRFQLMHKPNSYAASASNIPVLSVK